MESDPTPPPLPPNLPPSLPSGLPAPERRGAIVDGQVVPGTENLTATDIAEEVLAGGRFVLFRYCVSVVILTFLRPTRVVFLKRNEDAGKHAFGWSILSLFAGWWGFPWGPIYTIGSLITNAQGGKDLTREVLRVVIPDSAVEPLMQKRRKPSAGPMLWALRGLLVAAPIVLIGMISGIAVIGTAEEGRQKAQPGYAAFNAAHRAIDQTSTQLSGGNTPEAKTIAADVCSSMERLRTLFFEKKGGASALKPFHVWCEMHGESCVLLVQVPELRKFDAKAKDAICEMAWGVAQGASGKHLATGQSGSLSVGVRGFSLYERLMTGTRKPDIGGDAPATSVDSDPEIRRLLQEQFGGATASR